MNEKKDIRQLLATGLDLDEKSEKSLYKAIVENNQDGFDYIEFLVSVDKLKSMSLDEDTAIKSAFSTASTFGTTKDGLIRTAEYYKNVLIKEYEKFRGALAEQIEVKIDGPNSELIKMKKEFDGIDEEIEKLKRKKEVYQAELTKRSEGIEETKIKLKGTEENFNQAYTAIRDRIQMDIDKLKSIL